MKYTQPKIQISLFDEEHVVLTSSPVVPNFGEAYQGMVSYKNLNGEEIAVQFKR